MKWQTWRAETLVKWVWLSVLSLLAMIPVPVQAPDVPVRSDEYEHEDGVVQRTGHSKVGVRAMRELWFYLKPREGVQLVS